MQLSSSGQPDPSPAVYLTSFLQPPIQILQVHALHSAILSQSLWAWGKGDWQHNKLLGNPSFVSQSREANWMKVDLCGGFSYCAKALTKLTPLFLFCRNLSNLLSSMERLKLKSGEPGAAYGVSRAAVCHEWARVNLFWVTCELVKAPLKPVWFVLVVVFVCFCFVLNFYFLGGSHYKIWRGFLKFILLFIHLFIHCALILPDSRKDQERGMPERVQREVNALCRKFQLTVQTFRSLRVELSCWSTLSLPSPVGAVQQPVTLSATLNSFEFK